MYFCVVDILKGSRDGSVMHCSSVSIISIGRSPCVNSETYIDTICDTNTDYANMCSLSITGLLWDFNWADNIR